MLMKHIHSLYILNISNLHSLWSKVLSKRNYKVESEIKIIQPTLVVQTPDASSWIQMIYSASELIAQFFLCKQAKKI